MSKPSARASRHTPRNRSRTARSTSDRTIYIGFVVIGAFVAFLAAVLTGGEFWLHAVLAYCAIVALFVHRGALAIYRGRHDLPGWQRALARLLLRCAGYGTKGGKPIEASHGDPGTLRLIVISAVVTLAVLAGVAIWLLL